MLERILCIQRDERKHVFFFSLLALCWSTAASLGVVYSDALLLKFVGANSLPLAFTITACGMLIVSSLLIYLYNRKVISQIFQRWIFIAMGFYLITFSALAFGIQSHLFFITFKALSYIVQMGFFSCFWSFVDQYFELQNAKRLFGLFYSSIFLGTALAGAIISISATFYIIFAILCLMMASLMAAGFIVNYIQHHLPQLPDDFHEFAVTKTTTKVLLKAILESPFTILLLSFCIILQILMVITEYEYMFGLQKILHHQTADQLTPFLGKLYLWGSLFNIFFGIFMYGRLIKRAGLNNVVMIVPLFFTFLFGGWVMSSHLVFSIMGFIAVEGVLTLVEDNNFTLLLNAVPLKVKNKIRVISESLIEPIGILFSSLLMIIFQKESKILGLYLSIVFLCVALMLRSYYARGIFSNLIAHLFNFPEESTKLYPPISSRDFHKSKQAFMHQFLTLKSSEQFFLVECALKFNDLDFLKTLLEKITKLSSAIKTQVLDTLCDYPPQISDNFLPLMQQWALKKPKLFEHLVFHQAKMGLIELSAIPNDDSNPYFLASKCLLVLKNEPHNLDSIDILEHMLRSKNEEEAIIAIQTIRFTKTHCFIPSLINFLTHQDHLKQEILKTLATILEPIDTPFLSTLLLEINDEKNLFLRKLYLKCIESILCEDNIETIILHSSLWKSHERKHLIQIILNMNVIPKQILLNILENTQYPDKVRLVTGKVLAKVDKKLLKKSFLKLLDNELSRAYVYYYHYITIQKSYPYVNLSILTQALKNSYDSILDLMIQIQAHLQHFNQGEYLAQSIHSSNPKTKSHALETLQKLCSIKVYRKLQPLLETGHEKIFFRNYHRQSLPIFSLDSLMDLLEKSPSNVNRMIVFFLKNKLGLHGPKSEALRDSNFELNKEVLLK